MYLDYVADGQQNDSQVALAIEPLVCICCTAMARIRPLVFPLSYLTCNVALALRAQVTGPTPTSGPLPISARRLYDADVTVTLDIGKSASENSAPTASFADTDGVPIASNGHEMASVGSSQRMARSDAGE